MAKAKYDKYILSGMRPWNRRASGPIVAYWDDQVNRGAYKGSHQYYVHWVGLAPENLEGVTSWEDMGHGPHEHTYPEVIMHLGTDPFHPLELGAEVEFCLGPEMEKHTLTTSDAVYLPANFIHGPWIIRKVARPFIIVTVEQGPRHMEKSHQDMVPAREREDLLFIDEGYDSQHRVVKLARKMSGEW